MDCSQEYALKDLVKQGMKVQIVGIFQRMDSSGTIAEDAGDHAMAVNDLEELKGRLSGVFPGKYSEELAAHGIFVGDDDFGAAIDQIEAWMDYVIEWSKGLGKKDMQMLQQNLLMLSLFLDDKSQDAVKKALGLEKVTRLDQRRTALRQILTDKGGKAPFLSTNTDEAKAKRAALREKTQELLMPNMRHVMVSTLFLSEGDKDRYLAKNLMTVEDRSFGDTGLRLYPLGMGALGFGRQWPDGNEEYQRPKDQEIRDLILLAYNEATKQGGVLMIDTASAYGDSEQRLGEALEDLDLKDKVIIATKWGSSQDSWRTNFTIERLEEDVAQSIHHLGDINTLYIHYTSQSEPEELESIRPGSPVLARMAEMKADGYGGIELLGLTISNEEMLKAAYRENLFDAFDVIQMYASVAVNNPEFIEELRQRGKEIVLNSPFRKADEGETETPEKRRETLHEILQANETAIILTGTTNLAHLRENIDHVSSFTSAETDQAMAGGNTEKRDNLLQLAEELNASFSRDFSYEYFQILGEDENKDGILAELNELPGKGSGVHFGVGGMFNLDIVAMRRSRFAIIGDISERAQKTYRAIREAILDEQMTDENLPLEEKRKKFVDVLISKLKENGAFIGDRAIAPDLKVLLALKKSLEDPLSWLSSDEALLHIQKMFEEERFVFINLNVFDSVSFQKIGQWMKGEGLHLDTVYTSNMNGFIERGFLKRMPESTKETLEKNMAHMADSQTYIIETGEGGYITLRVRMFDQSTGKSGEGDPAETDQAMAAHENRGPRVESRGSQNAMRNAQSAMREDVGGIDMNNITIDRTETSNVIEFDMEAMQPLLDQNITGFAPIIIDIVPLPSVLPLLGLKEEGSQDPNVPGAQEILELSAAIKE